jgi:hypothetical protein
MTGEYPDIYPCLIGRLLGISTHTLGLWFLVGVPAVFATGSALLTLVRSGWRDAAADGYGAFCLGVSVMAALGLLIIFRGVVFSLFILALVLCGGIALWNGTRRVVRRVRDAVSGSGVKAAHDPGPCRPSENLPADAGETRIRSARERRGQAPIPRIAPTHRRREPP